MNLYTENGWINPDVILDNNYPFVLVIGGRGIGKSYGVMRSLYERQIPYIYMRRTQSQLDAITIPALNPYNQIAADMGKLITADRLGKYTIGFYNGVQDNDGVIRSSGEQFALGIALSTFASIRGLSAEKYEVLLFDEIIPERHERPIKEEELAFANALESLNRNRELNGRNPLKVIMLSNSNTLNSRIIAALGCTDVLERMSRRGEDYKVINNDILIIRYTDSPISKRKSGTALYRVIKNNDFQNMAIDNDFAAADYEFVSVKPLQEYTPIVSIGACTICKHKSKYEYYVISGATASKKYSMLPIEKKAFQRDYYHVYGALLKRHVYFQSASVKIEFEGAWS